MTLYDLDYSLLAGLGKANAMPGPARLFYRLDNAAGRVRSY